MRSQFSYLVGEHHPRGCHWQHGDVCLGDACFAAWALRSLRPIRRLQHMGWPAPDIGSGHHGSSLPLGGPQVLVCRQRVLVLSTHWVSVDSHTRKKGMLLCSLRLPHLLGSPFHLAYFPGERGVLTCFLRQVHCLLWHSVNEQPV